MRGLLHPALVATVVLSALTVAAQQAPPPQASPAQPAQDPAQPAQPAAQTPPGQDPNQPSDQRPVFKAGVNFVRIDAIVTDKSGKPIGDLTPEDFEIVERGKPQKIEAFKLVSLDGGLLTTEPPRQIRSDLDEESEAARDDVRLFAIFLDDYHVTRENSIRARPQLARFIQTQLGPSDMIGLMAPLDPVAAVRHTRNHDAVMRGVQEFEGRKYDYQPRTPEEERWMAIASAEQIERMRNQITFGAIRSLIVRMGALKEGRKSLILVSEGFSNTLPPQLRDPLASAPGFDNPFRDDPNAGDTPDEFRRQAFDGFDMSIDLRDVYDLANRQNVSIYPLDPRGLAGTEFGLDRGANVGFKTDNQFIRTTVDTLHTLAENSDGRAIVNRNDLLTGLKQIVVDSSFYYLIGYASTVGTPDGKFHEIEVKVKRPGLQVRHRKGYWALRPEDAARISSPSAPTPPSAVEAAMAANVAPRSRPVRTWLGTARGENGRTRLTFVWEPAARVAGQASEPERAARVSITATAPDGSPVYRGAAPAASSAGAAQGPAHVSFDVPPGPIQLKLTVEGVNAGVLDSEVRELTIPDLTMPQVSIATPQVFRARTLPELQRLKQDPGAVPTAGREFSRTERVFIRVPAYAPGGTAPKVGAKLLNRAGKPLGDLPVTPGATPEAAASFDLGLSNLAPGDYGIEVTVSGEAGQAREVIAFRVTS